MQQGMNSGFGKSEGGPVKISNSKEMVGYEA